MFPLQLTTKDTETKRNALNVTKQSLTQGLRAKTSVTYKASNHIFSVTVIILRARVIRPKPNPQPDGPGCCFVLPLSRRLILHRKTCREHKAPTSTALANQASSQHKVQHRQNHMPAYTTVSKSIFCDLKWLRILQREPLKITLPF